MTLQVQFKLNWLRVFKIKTRGETEKCSSGHPSSSFTLSFCARPCALNVHLQFFAKWRRNRRWNSTLMESSNVVLDFLSRYPYLFFVRFLHRFCSDFCSGFSSGFCSEHPHPRRYFFCPHSQSSAFRNLFWRKRVSFSASILHRFNIIEKVLGRYFSGARRNKIGSLKLQQTCNLNH